jgi:hypothetical protein
MRADGSMTAVELMTGMGQIYGFEVRDGGGGRVNFAPEPVAGSASGPHVQQLRSGQDFATASASSIEIPSGRGNGAEDPNITTNVLSLQKSKGERTMGRTMCKKGCGRQTVTQNDGMCIRCYKETHGLPVRAPIVLKTSGGGTVTPEPKSVRAKGHAEAAVRELTADAGALAKSAFSLGESLGAIREAPRHTRITVVTIETDSALPVAELMQLLRAGRG